MPLSIWTSIELLVCQAGVETKAFPGTEIRVINPALHPWLWPFSMSHLQRSNFFNHSECKISEKITSKEKSIHYCPSLLTSYGLYNLPLRILWKMIIQAAKTPAFPVNKIIPLTTVPLDLFLLFIYFCLGFDACLDPGTSERMLHECHSRIQPFVYFYHRPYHFSRNEICSFTVLTEISVFWIVSKHMLLIWHDSDKPSK